MKKKNKNFAGFTMLELLVVMVVIGILVTISVAFFTNHLREGRDAFRKAQIKTISSLVYLDRVNNEKSNYNLNKLEVETVLKGNSVDTIEAESGKDYFYGYSAKKENFFVVVCGESDEFFVEGTPAGITAVRSKDPLVACDGGSVPIKERNAPININALDTNLDAYTIYKLS